MSRRPQIPSDSLDLLLDTICNAFGGIVLIALLAALLANEVRVTEETHRLKEWSTEMLERRLERARNDLQAAIQYQQGLLAKLMDPGLKERAGLVGERDRLREESQSWDSVLTTAQQKLSESRAAIQQIPQERLRQLSEENRKLQRELAGEQNTLETARQNADRLRTRHADLLAQVKKVKQTRTRQLRLPKENPQLKHPVDVIIRYDQLFFVYDFTLRAFGRNTAALSFEPLTGGDTKVLPLQGRGLAWESTRTEAILRRLPREDCYIVCWVYGDSFRTFNFFKEMLVNAGYEYGWSPMSRGGYLTLTSDRVVSPPPL
jgi:hypothetical protein